MFEIIMRSQAIKEGRTHYFTGKPCKHGHVAMRRVKGTCMECDRSIQQRKRALLGQEYQSRYAKYYAEWYASNRAKKVQNVLQRYYSDVESSRIEKRNQRNARKDQINARKRELYLERSAEIVQQVAKRQAAKLRAIPIWYGELDQLVEIEARRLVRLREKCTGVRWHIDHMIPLRSKTATGFHCANNLQVIPASMNCSKRNTHVFTEPGEWIRHT